MKLNIIIDDYTMDLNVPEDFLEASAERFDRLDASMDKGVQMGRDWIDRPDRHQRCQIAADKLLTALESHDEKLAMLSAGYILSRLPGVVRVRIDNSGEVRGTLFE
jgi:hypothetical protein